MRRAILFVFAFCCLTLALHVHAQDGGERQLAPVVLTDRQDKYPLGRHLEILEDPGSALTIEDVTSPAYTQQFVPSEVDVPSFGFTDSAYWVRLRLRAENAESNRWLLGVDFDNTHFVDLYSPTPDGDGFEVRETGTMRPPSSRDLAYPQTVFELTLPEQEEQTYYLRFKNGAPMVLALTLWETNAFFTESLGRWVTEMLVYGIMAGLLAYNLFLAVSLRDANYFYLAAFLAAAVLFSLSQTSLLEMYVAPGLYRYKEEVIGLSSVGILISVLVFSASFVDARTNMPRVYQINLMLIGFAALLGLAAFAFDYHQVAVILSPTVVLVSVFVIMFVAVAWKRGYHSARFLMIAMTGLLVCLLVFILARLGVIPVSTVTENAFRLGLIWMAVCSSLALVDRVNLLQTETVMTGRQLRLSEQRLLQTLEAMPVGVVVYGVDQKPTYLNKRTNDILSSPEQGIGPDLSAGRTLAEAISYFSFRVAGSEEAYPIEELPVRRALKGEASSVDDVEAHLHDRRVPLEIWASPVFDDNGKVETAVVAFQDITNRKKAEQALRTSEKKFRVIVENVFDGIAFLDRDRTILYVSPSYEQLNGISAEEMLGKKGTGTVHPDDEPYVGAAFQKMLRAPGSMVSEEYRIRHQNGSWVWVETRVMNMLDDPHVRAVVLNSRDISERKRKDAELDEYREHLERLVEERTAKLNTINERLFDEVAERTMLEGLLYKRIEWMSAMSQARQKVRGTADLRNVYATLLKCIQRLFDTRAVLLICWLDQNDSGEFLCRLVQGGPGQDIEELKIPYSGNSAPLQKVEQGKPRLYTAAETHLLPEPLQACLAEDSAESLLLIPISTDESVSGVLGLVLPQNGQTHVQAQDELLSEIAFDMAGLNEYASFLDQSRALFAAEERSRIARDLHDSVTQVLFSASLVAEVLPKIWRSDPKKGEASLDELRRLTRGAMAEMRTMLLELRPAALIKSPLPELLTQLTEATTSRNALPFRLLIEQIPALPEEVHFCYYRVAQEALNNVAKHARASEVTLVLRARLQNSPADQAPRYEVQLIVDDDGVGFNPEAGHSDQRLGLSIMRERAADIQAELAIESEIGEGTRLTLIWCGAVRDS